MSACITNTANMSARAPQPATKQGLFAVGYESTGRTGWQ